MTVWEVLKNFKGYDGKFSIINRNGEMLIWQKIDFYDMQNVLDYEYYETEEEYNDFEDIAEKNVLKIDLELNTIIID